MMKRTLLFLLALAGSLYGQVNFTITGTIPTAQFASLEAARVLLHANGAIAALNGGVTSGATSLVATATPAGWTTGALSARPATCTQQDPTLFPFTLYFSTDNSTIYTCVSTNVWGVFAAEILIDSEAVDVTAISGNTWTIARAKGQTSAAAHSTAAPIYLLVYPSAVLWAKQFIRAGLASILGSDAAVVAQQAVIANDQKVLLNLENASVQ